jgi:hypothetical protein
VRQHAVVLPLSSCRYESPSLFPPGDLGFERRITSLDRSQRSIPRRICQDSEMPSSSLMRRSAAAVSGSILKLRIVVMCAARFFDIGILRTQSGVGNTIY